MILGDKRKEIYKPGLLTPSAREDALPLDLGQQRNEASPIEYQKEALP